MRIIEIPNPKKENNVFDYSFLIYPTTDKEIEEMYNLQDNIGFWLQDNTERNYIFLANYANIIGGGYQAGYPESYSIYNNDDESEVDEPRLDHYEVRLYEIDAIKFKLRWIY